METEPHFLRKLGRGPVDLAAQTAGITSGYQDGHHCWDMEVTLCFSPIHVSSEHCTWGFPSRSLTRVCAGGGLGIRSHEYWDLGMLRHKERRYLVWRYLGSHLNISKAIT